MSFSTGSFVSSIISHDADYVSRNLHDGSDFESKLDALSSFEKQFSEANERLYLLFGECMDNEFDLPFNLCRIAEKILKASKSLI